MRTAEPTPTGSAPAGAQMGSGSISEIADSGEAHEVEADRAADHVVRRLDDPPPVASTHGLQPAQAPAPGLAVLGTVRPPAAGLRRRAAVAFGWDFSGGRVHAAPAPSDASARLAAIARAH